MAEDAARYFDACVYTTPQGREQLRIAALVVAKAILGYSPDELRRRDALNLQHALEKRPGALDLCITIRETWKLAMVAQPGIPEIITAQNQLEAVAKNVYSGRMAGGFSWGAFLFGAAIVGAGLWGWRAYKKNGRLLPAG